MKNVPIKQTNRNNSKEESTKDSRKKKLPAKTAKSFAYKLIDTLARKS
jgi:hypothetical protein